MKVGVKKKKAMEILENPAETIGFSFRNQKQEIRNNVVLVNCKEWLKRRDFWRMKEQSNNAAKETISLINLTLNQHFSLLTMILQPTFNWQLSFQCNHYKKLYLVIINNMAS